TRGSRAVTTVSSRPFRCLRRLYHRGERIEGRRRVGVVGAFGAPDREVGSGSSVLKVCPSRRRPERTNSVCGDLVRLWSQQQVSELRVAFASSRSENLAGVVDSESLQKGPARRNLRAQVGDRRVWVARLVNEVEANDLIMVIDVFRLTSCAAPKRRRIQVIP